jgi:hypothetical protein
MTDKTIELKSTPMKPNTSAVPDKDTFYIEVKLKVNYFGKDKL